MSILINKKTRAIVQGITGNHGRFNTLKMLEAGTKIVAGVSKNREVKYVENIPVYLTVKEALKKHKAEWSVIFVPAKFAKDAAIEALENNLNIVIITEEMPVHDVIEIVNIANKKNLTVIGPNCPGIFSIGESKLGIIPNNIVKKGDVGIISRSGTLTYEVISHLSKNNLGQSTAVGIGGDMVIGSNFIKLLKMFEKDKDTKRIVIVGEIGGELEEKTAEFLKKSKFKKNVVAYITGVSAQEGKRMGHAGAIITGNKGTAASKIKAFESAGIKVAKVPSEIIKLLKH